MEQNTSINPASLTAVNLTPEGEGLAIRKALRTLHRFDVRGGWVDHLLAHVLGIKLIQYEDDGYDRVRTNVKPWLVNGMGIFFSVFAVDEDLEFIHADHKFDAAGFRTVDVAELSRRIKHWGFDGSTYNDCDVNEYFDHRQTLTAPRRKQLLVILAKAGLMDIKPSPQRSTMIIRLRGDRIIPTLKRILPPIYQGPFN